MTVRTHSPVAAWLSQYLANQPDAPPKRAWFFLVTCPPPAVPG